MFCRSLHLKGKFTSLPASLVRLEDLALSVPVHCHGNLSSVNCLTGLTRLCLELQYQDDTLLPVLDLSRHALRELQLFWLGGREGGAEEI